MGNLIRPVSYPQNAFCKIAEAAKHMKACEMNWNEHHNVLLKWENVFYRKPLKPKWHCTEILHNRTERVVSDVF